ncbi:unnamed protein product, partial [Rangifer tarandus platyrhynchus]
YLYCTKGLPRWRSVQFSSVAQSCLTLCSTPGLLVHHQLLENLEKQKTISFITQTVIDRPQSSCEPKYLITLSNNLQKYFLRIKQQCCGLASSCLNMLN